MGFSWDLLAGLIINADPNFAEDSEAPAETHIGSRIEINGDERVIVWLDGPAPWPSGF